MTWRPPWVRTLRTCRNRRGRQSPHVGCSRLALRPKQQCQHLSARPLGDVICHRRVGADRSKSLITGSFDMSDRTAQALHTHDARAEMVQIRKAQGFALIDVIFVCGMIWLLCSIALPRLLLAKQSASAASAVGS